MNSVALVQCNGIPEKLTVAQSSSKSGNLISLSKHSTLSAEAKQISKQVMDTARKKAKVKELVSIRATPPPAVARRNARERNRVKQVNNGFANLRQRIPNSIASAFESGRSGNKKLSKVETLRMAVEYIRSLEELLALSDSSPSKESLTYPASTPLLSLETQSSTNYSSSVASPSSEDDNFSSNSTPPPLHYIKVSGSDAYSILPVHLVENNERLNSLKIRNELLSNSSVLKFKNEQLSNTIGLGTPRSPGIYSESSLSPGTESDVQAFIPIFNMGELSPSPPTIKVEEVSESANEEMRILCHNLIMLQADGEGDLAKQLNMNELITW